MEPQVTKEIEIVEVGNGVSAVETMKRNYTLMTEATKSLMVNGVDFGVIPGVSKPSLMKPGAEKLRMLFAFETKTERTGEEMDIPSGFYDVTYKVSVFDRAGRTIAECEGSCNTYEEKYRYRTVKITPPADTEERQRLIDSGEIKNGKYGWTKKVPNPDVIGLKNTVQKMAQKRAFVGALLIATGASQFYTQDVEDMPEFVRSDAPAPVEKEPPKDLPPKPMDAATREEILVLVAQLQTADPSKTVEASNAKIKEKFGKELDALTYPEALQLKRSLEITLEAAMDAKTKAPIDDTDSVNSIRSAHMLSEDM